jgi:exonuclease SbcD
MVYDALLPYNDEWRYNPKMLWTGQNDAQQQEKEQQVFEVAELQQMTDPMQFIERTKDQYPGLDIEDVRRAFEEVKAEMHRMDEERQAKNRQKTNPAEQ